MDDEHRSNVWRQDLWVLEPCNPLEHFQGIWLVGLYIQILRKVGLPYCSRYPDKQVILISVV